MSAKDITISLKSDLVDTCIVHKNLQHEVVVITVDRIKLCLLSHQGRQTIRGAWVAPFGILLTLVSTLNTTTFNERFYLSADTWKAIYIIGTIGNALWLIHALYERFLVKPSGVDEIVSELKTQGQAIEGVGN